jgi:hypothetical protein
MDTAAPSASAGHLGVAVRAVIEAIDRQAARRHFGRFIRCMPTYTTTSASSTKMTAPPPM